MSISHANHYSSIQSSPVTGSRIGSLTMEPTTVAYERDDVVGDCDDIGILVEVIGARSLVLREEDELVRDIDPSSIRPFCIIKFDGQRIHKTKKSEDYGCDPIWTPHFSKSIFLLETTARSMSRSILNISLHTKIKSSLPSVLTTATSAFLGQVHIDSSTLLSHCDEKRFELNIEDEYGEHLSNLGKLALRCRVATPSDISMLAVLNGEEVSAPTGDITDIILDDFNGENTAEPQIYSKRIDRRVATLVTEKAGAQMAQNSLVESARNLFVSNTATCSQTGQTKVRVKPYPDPERKEETEFLKPFDIKVQTRSASTNWVEAGSGSIGKLFVEILSCDDLPNLDSGGEMIGNYTDSFCTVVFEDTCAMTDVIYDELSPRWLPWTKRAFSFNVMHPASVLYLGVFDFDVLGGHDPIGRVAVNVCNLQRDTIHTLSYNLYPASNVTERTAVGSVTIRLRLEWFDPRAALLAGCKPRPTMHVNVSKEKTFRVVRYTCFGEYDNPTHFNTTLTRSYVNELFEYKRNIGYVVKDALKSLVFWRGQVKVFSIMLPVHSMVFFLGSSRLVEKPQLIVPYSLLGGAWIMLASLTIRRQHPSPWQRRLSFMDYLDILRTGKASTKVKYIKEFEGAEDAEKYELAWKKRVDRDLKMTLKKAELVKQISEIDVGIETKVENSSLIPADLLNRLGRYQGIMSRMCKKFRFMKIILTWEESIISFFVTATFLSSGLVALVLPWGFILTWTGRIVVWGFLGPHMKLVDLFLRAKEKKDIDAVMKNFDIQSYNARLKREESLKVKDLKEVAFGKYSVQVPSFNLCKFVAHIFVQVVNRYAFSHFFSISFPCSARHFDRPLPQSSSRVCRQNPKAINRARKRRVSVAEIGRKNPLIPGQQLYGDMIPRPEYDEKIFQYQRTVAEQKMQSFRERVKRINSLDGLSEYERRQLIKSEALMGTPMSIGYEVALLEKSGSMTTDTDSSDDTEPEQPTARPYCLRSVSVRLESDKMGYVDRREGRDMIFESDGIATYCISERDEVGEEGMEIVGTLPDSYDIFPSNTPTDERQESCRSEISQISSAEDNVVPFVFRSDISQVSTTEVDNGLSCVFECEDELQDVCAPHLDGVLMKHKIE